MKERYVVHMRDGLDNGRYYLTESKELFEEVDKCPDDDELIEFMQENEDQFEIVDDLAGIGVIEQIVGCFY